MSHSAAPRRGEVYWLDFAPASGQGRPQQHPCVVVQHDCENDHRPVTIVAAISSDLRIQALPLGVLLKHGDAGLPKDSVVNCGHLYTVSKSQLKDRIGQLSKAEMAAVEKALVYILGLVDTERTSTTSATGVSAH